MNVLNCFASLVFVLGSCCSVNGQSSGNEASDVSAAEFRSIDFQSKVPWSARFRSADYDLSLHREWPRGRDRPSRSTDSWPGAACGQQPMGNCADGRCAVDAACVNCGLTVSNCHCSTDRTDQRSTLRDTPFSTSRSTPSRVPRAIAWHADTRRAAAIADQTGRPMLLRITADWCGFCRRMNREAFVDSRIIRDVGRTFVSVNVDADTNEALVRQLQVSSLPATVIVLPDFKVIQRIEGFRSANQLGQALSPHFQRARAAAEMNIAVR